jgi:HK97 family phage major capsid protein
MADIKALAEKRASLLTQASDLVAEQAAAGAALAGEAQERFEKLTAEAAALADAIKSEREAVEARKAADVARVEYAAAVAPKATEARDLNAEFRRIARDGGEIEVRDISRSTFTQAVEQGDRFWVTAAAYDPFLNPAIVDLMSMATGNAVALPRTTVLGTADAYSEGSAISASDGTSSSLSLTPAKYANLCAVGVETVNDEAFDVAAWVTAKMGAEISAAFGAVAAPAVAAAATVGKQGAAVTPTVADLVALVYSVNARERRSPKAAFLMNDATLAGIIGLADDQHRPIFIPGDLNRPDSIMGYPVHGAQLVNTGDEALSILFGNLDAVKVSVVAPGLVVESSRDYLFNKAQVAYRGHIRAAAGLIDPAAVKSFKGANV